MKKKCKKGSKGRTCRVIKKTKKWFPRKGKPLFVWVLGALIEFAGFYFMFSSKKYLLGCILVIVGLVTALSSRTIKK